MVFYVYVIELDPRVADYKKFRKVNPERDPDFACYYVGQTVHSPELRFEKHKQGGKLSNSYVHRFGIRLCPKLYEKYNPVPTRNDAMELEGYLAERLRSRGHGVWVN